MTGTGERKRLSENKALLICFLLVSAAIRVVLSLFPKVLTVYPDELINVQLAQSIEQYGKLIANGTPSLYPGILYPALLSPFCRIMNPETRLTAVAVLNALLVSSALIPAWLLCRRCLQKESGRLLALALFVLLPDLWICVTLMSECLYIPMALWSVVFLHRSFREGSPGPGRSCALGVWMYLVWLTARSGIAMAAGTLGLFVYEAAAGKDRKAALRDGLCWLGSFCLVYLAGMLLFGGKLYGYGIPLPESPQALMFLLFAGAGLLLHFVTGVLLFPVAVPVARRKQQGGIYGRLVFFLILYTVSAALLTAAEISVPEDFGSMEIRVVLRMMVPAAWLFLVLYLAALESDEGERISFRHPAVVLSAVLIVLGALMLRLPRFAGPSDAPMLLWTGMLKDQGIPGLLLKAVPAAVLLAGLFLVKQGKGKAVAAGVAALLLAGSAVNGWLLVKQSKEAGSLPEEEIRIQARELDQFLNGLEGNILLIRPAVSDEKEQITDAYCRTGRCYSAGMTELRRTAGGAPDPGNISLRDAGIDADQIDYILCREDLFEMCPAGGTEITPENISYMHIYKNAQADSLNLTGLFALRPGQSIRFTKENPEHLGYPVSGFSAPESGFTWTEGREASVELIPVSRGNTPLELVWTRKMTIGGEQRCVVFANEKPVFDGTVSGGGELRIPLPQEMTEKGEPVTIRFDLPDAKQPGNGDPRLLAVAFESLSLEEREAGGTD